EAVSRALSFALQAGIERCGWNWRRYAASTADRCVRRAVNSWHDSPTEFTERYLFEGRAATRKASVETVSAYLARAVMRRDRSRSAKLAWKCARSSLLNAVTPWSMSPMSVAFHIAFITPVAEWPGSFRRR